MATATLLLFTAQSLRGADELLLLFMGLKLTAEQELVLFCMSFCTRNKIGAKYEFFTSVRSQTISAFKKISLPALVIL